MARNKKTTRRQNRVAQRGGEETPSTEPAPTVTASPTPTEQPQPPTKTGMWLWPVKLWGGRKTFKNRNKTMKRHRTMRVKTGGKSPRVVGRIYSDSCGFCVAMKDAWGEMKTKMQEQGKEVVKFADIEAQEMNEKLDELNKRLVSPQKVSIQGGFPTLFKIHGGKVEYYEGERSADKMYDWFMK
jgi:hypothetical protein